jgi:hypothetical protein
MKCPSNEETLSKCSSVVEYMCSGVWGANHLTSVQCKLGCYTDEEGYGCPEKHGCLPQAQVPLFVAT